MLSLKTSRLLSSALLIQSFVFQGAALELSQGELDGYLEDVAEFLMEEGKRQVPPLPPPTPHHHQQLPQRQPPLNHRRNFTSGCPTCLRSSTRTSSSCTRRPVNQAAS